MDVVSDPRASSGQAFARSAGVPLADPMPVDRLDAEISSLRVRGALVRRGPFEVYLAKAHAIPCLMTEICRLRELSFRAAGEGTGQARDRDVFDGHYEHLFLWNTISREVVGAYRLAVSDDVMPEVGVRGLYSSTLFDFDERLFEHVGVAMELGRAFVAPKWQRGFQPLRLLWGGIAAILRARPGIACLFGLVSISAEFGASSRSLIVDALTLHHGDQELSALVQPRHAPAASGARASQRLVASALADIDLLSRAVSRLEGGTALPVLVRQYVELKGRFAGFCVDAGFGGTLDGLVFVKVNRIPASVMERFNKLTLARAGDVPTDRVHDVEV